MKPDKGYIGHRAAKLMKRSKSIEKRKNQNREEKQSLLKDVEEYNDLKMFPLTYFQSQLVQLSHISIAYQDRIIINDLFMTICMGERILLKGHNGSGKSSLIRLIVNKTSQDGIEINHQLKISYVPQDCSYLQGDLDDLIESYHLDCSLVKSILIQFGLTKDHFYKPLQHYSLGQKKKVMLAISIASPAHLYIWDEPLNYIDIFSRIQLERVILKYQPTLLFVEHDEYFQENIATNSIDLGELI